MHAERRQSQQAGQGRRLGTTVHPTYVCACVDLGLEIRAEEEERDVSYGTPEPLDLCFSDL